jgi:hypothetical protein
VELDDKKMREILLVRETRLSRASMTTRRGEGWKKEIRRKSAHKKIIQQINIK